MVLSSEGSMPYERGIVQLFTSPHPARTGPSDGGLDQVVQHLQFGQQFLQCSGCYYLPGIDPTPADDCFALGCIASEIFGSRGKPLFHSPEELSRYLDGHETRDWARELSNLPRDVAAFVTDTLRRDRLERPTVSQLGCSTVFPAELVLVHSTLCSMSSGSPSEQIHLLREHMPQFIGMKHTELFLLMLPMFLSLLQNKQIQLEALALFDPISSKLGTALTQRHLRQPLQALFQSNCPQTRRILVRLELLQVLIDRLGPQSFLQHIFGLVADTLRYKDPDAAKQALQSVVLISYNLGATLTVSGMLPPLLRQLGKQNCDLVVRALILLCVRVGEPVCSSCVLPKLIQAIRPQNHVYHETQGELYRAVLQVLTGIMGRVLSEHITREMLIVESNPIFRMALAPTLSAELVPHVVDAVAKLCQTIGAANMRRHVMHYVHQLFQHIGDRLKEATMGALPAGSDIDADQQQELLTFIWRELFSPLAKVVGHHDMCHALCAGTCSFVVDTMVPFFTHRAQANPEPSPRSPVHQGSFENEVAESFIDSIPPHWVETSRASSSWNLEGVGISSFKAHEGGVKRLCSTRLMGQEVLLSGGGSNKGGVVRIWSIPKMMCDQSYVGHSDAVIDLAMLDQSKVASCDHTVHVWDPQTGQASLASGTKSKLQVWCIKALSSSTLLLGTSDSTLQTLDCRMGQNVSQWKLSKNPSQLGGVRSLCVQEAGAEHLVAAGTTSGHVGFLDQRFGIIKGTKKTHTGKVCAMAAVGADTIYSGSTEKDSCVCVWSVSNQSQLQQSMISGFDTGVVDMALSDTILFCTSKHAIGLIDISSNHAVGAAAHEVPLQMLSDSQPVKSPITCSSLLNYHNLLAVGCDDGNIRICK
eukprot:TRINITY_DN9355_c0_g1_i1.p1 TRINITY_DN9355_c0_g1~~TRINITY_DN9355_c0_g1_i1.p1  ORF type:complete len:872 (+),score=131.53 TRINITY_DN9355_c0_g1_i1:389-3004(+)